MKYNVCILKDNEKTVEYETDNFKGAYVYAKALYNWLPKEEDTRCFETLGDIESKVESRLEVEVFGVGNNIISIEKII